VVLFSHADPIKSALVYFLGASIDFLPRLEISPGSISTVVIGKGSVQIPGINLLP
jgi:broad specificity phosphatase PhoE